METIAESVDETVEAIDSNKLDAYEKMIYFDENCPISTNIRPEAYEIYLHPNIFLDTFSGTVNIFFRVLVLTKIIPIHVKNLKIMPDLRLVTDRGEEKINYKITILDVSISKKYDIIEIKTKEDLKGAYRLFLRFHGNLKDEDKHGFCCSQYVLFYNNTYKEIYDRPPKYKRKKIRYLANTKLEPFYAKEVFPCFDEPIFKTPFRIKLVIPSTLRDHYNAISNMPIVNEEIDEPSGLTTVTFKQSLPMSTYQVRFLVSDFHSTKKKAVTQIENGCLISVYTTRAQAKENRYFALNIGVKALEYYVTKINVPYQLPKFDMIAVPNLSSPTKSWEVATFKETELLYDEYNNSITHKRKIVITICHKLAYSYFEQFVTLRWWNDLWFNEAFATFFSYKCANNILPNQGYMEQFLFDVMHSVLVTDAELNTHPLIHNVKNPSEISSFFDEISCKKGACLIRMMKNFLGSKAFYNNIRKFISDGPSEAAHYIRLFNTMHYQTREPIVNVKDIMDTWTRQEGYPVINVERSGNKFVLTQKRFLANPDTECNTSKSDYGYRWTVPITYITNRNEIPTLVWFDKDASEVLIEVDEQTRWVKFNADQIGYYRVNYGKEWATFTNLLFCNPTRLSVSDRANLLDDLFNLAEAGEVDYTILWNFTSYLNQEYRALPWAVMCSRLKRMYFLLNIANEDPTCYLQNYVSRLVSVIYKDLTWTVDDAVREDLPLTYVDEKMRAMILELACIIDVPDCRKKASAILFDWLTNWKRPHPDICELVYHYGVHYLKEEDWNCMIRLYEEEVDPIEKRKILLGITGVQSAEWLKNLIIKITLDHFPADLLECLILISENPAGIWVVWDWVRDNWEYLVKKYTLNNECLGELIPAITKFFAAETRLNEMKAFFEKFPKAGVDANNRAKALKTVSDNIKWVKTKGTLFNNWYMITLSSLKFNSICNLLYC